VYEEVLQGRRWCSCFNRSQMKRRIGDFYGVYINKPSRLSRLSLFSRTKVLQRRPASPLECFEAIRFRRLAHEGELVCIMANPTGKYEAGARSRDVPYSRFPITNLRTYVTNQPTTYSPPPVRTCTRQRAYLGVPEALGSQCEGGDQEQR
jgi:hypothetical protein